MDRDQRNEAAHDLAGWCARRFDEYIDEESLPDSAVTRTAGGEHYKITDTATRGSICFVKYKGEEFAFNVLPLANRGYDRLPQMHESADRHTEAPGCST
jgi:hypothetical protein